MAAYKWVVGKVTETWLQDVNASLELDANDDVSVVVESDAGCNEGWHVQDRHGEWDVTIEGHVEPKAQEMVQWAREAARCEQESLREQFTEGK